MTNRTENLLIEDAEEYGFVAMRAPASGGRADHEGGDLWIGREHPLWGESGTELFMIEEKYKNSEKDKYVRIDGEKLDAMIETAEAMGADPLIAVRWSRKTTWSPGSTHWIGDARGLERTDSGNVTVKPETAKSEFVATDRFFGRKASEAKS